MSGLFVFVVAFFGIAGCALFGPKERAELSNHANILEQCQEEGRTASKVCQGTGGENCDRDAIKAYSACKVDAGVK